MARTTDLGGRKQSMESWVGFLLLFRIAEYIIPLFKYYDTFEKKKKKG
jgi:hypothetical protein